MEVTDAGYLWLKKIAQNGVVVLDDGDMVDEAVFGLNLPTDQNPGIGWTGYSTYETTLDGELNMSPCWNLNPVIGVFKTSFLGIANNAPHPNAAKLFIKFILSEAGFAPWNEIGTYPAAVGLTANENNLPLAEMMPQVWEMDPLFDWENVSKVRDFWAASLLGQ
jgi:iron(III) transport system substrate-binding protein